METRADFLDKMQTLSANISEVPTGEENIESDEIEIDSDLVRLQNLIEAGEAAEAFFMARSLFTNGELWAEEWMIKAQSLL